MRINNRIPSSYWTKENCHKEALKHNRRIDFKRAQSNAYKICSDNDWLDEVCSHMQVILKKRGYWTKECCHQEALKYNSKTEFQKNSASAYTIASHNGWIDEICSHMQLVRKPNNYWTKECCHQEALKYTYKTEFQKAHPTVYGIASKKGWIDEICSHMLLTKKPKGYWTKERCRQEALKYKSVVGFMKGSPSAYGAASRKGWLDEICSHMQTRKKTREYWTKERCHQEALKYNIKSDFQKKSPTAFGIASHNGWIDEICSHMKLRYPWKTKEACHKEALKYNIKTEFMTGSPGAYGSASRNGFLDEICSHMINPQKDFKPKGYWTKERCSQEALKWNCLTEFRVGSPSAYGAASKNDWLDEICSHMSRKFAKKKLTTNDQYKLILEGKKYCPRCETIKTLENFTHSKFNKMGYQSKCKSCYKEYAFEKRIHLDKGLVWKKSLILEGKKYCPLCDEIKLLEDFSNLKKSYTGKASSCKSCKSITDKNYRDKVRESDSYAEKKRNYYLKNIDKHRIKQKNRKRDYADEYQRSKNNPIRNFKKKIRTLVYNALNGNKKSLGKSTEEILKCSWEELIEHLPVKDETFQVHHLIPIGHGKTIDELVRLSHHKNLKQIPGKLNGSVGKRIIVEWITPELEILFPDILERHKKFIVSIFDFYEEIKITKNKKLIKQCEDEIRKLDKFNIDKKEIFLI